MTKTGLFFGSFNPIHLGHLMIASYIVEYTDIDELWFVVSPQNPLKKKSTLLDNYQRFEMVYRSIKDDFRFKASDIEFKLPVPSYTVDTLAYLEDKNPGRRYVMIMGADGLLTFNRWKNYEVIVQRYERYVYPRSGIEKSEILKHKNVHLVNAPMIEISSSFIRKAVKEGKDVRYFMPMEAYLYMAEMNFYK